jgi:ribosomal protein S18 acetylase RimI-like enzyme
VGYVAVAPEVWGRGLGGALMRALPQRLRGLGYERARLWVYVDNARAVSLYESAGWSAKGEATIHPRSRKRGRYYELGL